MLIFGPPGLGKTTLAHIIAAELGVNLRQTSGPVLERPGDLAALLTNLQPRDVLFVDEIHRLAPVVEEVLYPAMEDYQLDIMIGEGPAARSIKLNLPPFTLVGATTRAGLLTSPLRDRFGIVQRLEFYGVEELERIVQPLGGDSRGEHRRGRRAAHRAALARHAAHRQPPVAAGTRLRAGARRRAASSESIADAALDLLEVDALGFDTLDRKLLSAIIERFDGGPVGIDSLAAALGEERGTLEDVTEPFLIQQGFLVRTARGRMVDARLLPALRHQAAGARRDAAAVRGRAVSVFSLAGARLLGGYRRRRASSTTPTTCASSSARAPSGCGRCGHSQRELAQEPGHPVHGGECPGRIPRAGAARRRAARSPASRGRKGGLAALRAAHLSRRRRASAPTADGLLVEANVRVACVDARSLRPAAPAAVPARGRGAEAVASNG